MAIEPMVSLDNGALPTGPQFWLDAAQATVRQYCGWHVAPSITEGLVLDGTGGRVLLVPSNKVTAVTAATNDGRDVLAELQWSETGVFILPAGWAKKNRAVTLTITHGYAEAPDVAGLIVDLASRASTGPAGVVSQNAGPQGVRYATAAGGAPVRIPLLESEKEALSPYKLNWGA